MRSNQQRNIKKLEIKVFFAQWGATVSQYWTQNTWANQKRREKNRGCPNLLFSLRQQNKQVIIFKKTGQKYFKGMTVSAKLINSFHIVLPVYQMQSLITLLVLHHSSSLYMDLCFFLISCFCFYLILS